MTAKAERVLLLQELKPSGTEAHARLSPPRRGEGGGTRRDAQRYGMAKGGQEEAHGSSSTCDQKIQTIKQGS